MTLNSISPFEGFSKLSFKERQAKLREFCNLSTDDLAILAQEKESLTVDVAEHLIENVVGMFSLPLGIATHFLIDGKDKVIPMAVEETSIIAAASSAAKWVRKSGGFKTKILGSQIIGQIQFPTVKNPDRFLSILSENEEELLAKANSFIPSLVARGGGVREIKFRFLKRPDEQSMVVVHLLCDPCDAMGANIINQVCELMKPIFEELTSEKVGLCILSNLVDSKLVESSCVIEDIDPVLGKAIEEATLFANLDPYRAATHNKGVMNGIDPVLIATGNDWRAVEAGVHAYCSLSGKYQSITSWKFSDGKLHGKLTAPIVVGTVGGVTKSHPTVKVCMKLLGIERAEDLSRICATAGLAQNLAALRALCSEGIVRGHMRLHASNLAMAAGATVEEIPHVEIILKRENKITLSRAKEILEQHRQKRVTPFIEANP